MEVRSFVVKGGFMGVDIHDGFDVYKEKGIHRTYYRIHMKLEVSFYFHSYPEFAPGKVCTDKQ